MARRRTSTTGGSLDSLLDTMTNVVGILIIVLIVTQLNVSSAAKRIRANLPDVDAADLANARETLEAARADTEQLRSSQDAPPVKPEDLEKLERERKQFEEKIAALETRKAEMKKLRDQLAAALRDADAAKKLLSTHDARLAGLITRRDEAKQQADREPRVVRLPNPREPQEGSKELRMICRGGKILPVNLSETAQRMSERIKSQKSLLVPQSNNLYRRDALTKWLETVKDAHPDFVSKFRIFPGGTIELQLTPKDGKGEPPEIINRPESAVRSTLAKAGFNRDHIRFFVTSDSFDAYIAARAAAEKMNLPVGWVFADDSGTITTGLPGVRAEPLPNLKPPPSPTNQPAKPTRGDILD